MFSTDKLNAVYAKYQTSWDAIKYWSDELHKLIHWLVLLSGGVTYLFSESVSLGMPLCSIGAVGWCFLYLRGVYWWNTNSATFATLSEELTRLCDDGNLADDTADQSKAMDKKSKAIPAVFRSYQSVEER